MDEQEGMEQLWRLYQMDLYEGRVWSQHLECPEDGQQQQWSVLNGHDRLQLGLSRGHLRGARLDSEVARGLYQGAALHPLDRQSRAREYPQ